MAKLFFSYSHRDEELRNELETHLVTLQRQGILSTWHDRRISAGSTLDKEINTHLEQADIILLLVSPYFIASNYCYGVEMTKALEKQINGSASVIPVILHPCDWHGLPFGKLRATPNDGKPVSKFPNLHDAFLEITLAIKEVAQKVNTPRQTTQTGLTHRTPSILGPNQSSLLSKPRSSNLKVRKEFTEREKDKFLQETFEYVSNYFEESLQELESRNANIETNFRRIDANHFSVTAYKDGKKVASCKIWLSARGSFGNGIAYSVDESSRDSSLNDSLSVEDDGNILFLKTFMSSFGTRLAQDNKLSMEGGAEYYWSRFIEPLQR